jgi:hypothetical protein
MLINMIPLEDEHPDKSQDVSRVIGKIIESSAKAGLEFEKTCYVAIENICDQAYAKENCKQFFMSGQNQV